MKTRVKYQSIWEQFEAIKSPSLQQAQSHQALYPIHLPEMQTDPVWPQLHMPVMSLNVVSAHIFWNQTSKTDDF